MAESETDQILDGVDPPTTETAETPAAEDTVAGGEGDDTTTAEWGEDTVAGEGGEEAAVEEAAEEPTQATAQAATAPPDDAAYKLAVTTLETLQTQQTALDAEFDQLDKDVAAGTVDSMDAGSKIQLLTARQTRLERKIAIASKAVSDQEKAIAQHKAQATESHWKALGKKYADIAETQEKATETLKEIWDEEYGKAVTAMPGAHPERIAGKAEAAWENRVAVLRAQRGTAKPGAKPAAKPPGRLTPSGGTAPTSPAKENGAVVAERTLGPLSAYKF